VWSVCVGGVGCGVAAWRLRCACVGLIPMVPLGGWWTTCRLCTYLLQAMLTFCSIMFMSCFNRPDRFAVGASSRSRVRKLGTAKTESGAHARPRRTRQLVEVEKGGCTKAISHERPATLSTPHTRLITRFTRLARRCFYSRRPQRSSSVRVLLR